MARFEFFDKSSARELLDTSISKNLMLKRSEADELDDRVRTYFHNGDRLTVDLEAGTLEWEPLDPGKLASSQLSMRIHQWLGKYRICPAKGPAKGPGTASRTPSRTSGIRTRGTRAS